MGKIVLKITPDIDPTTVEATTYQMRNFYRQFGDGFYSVLDVMNYIQHQQIVHWSRKGQHLLDVCCGRGLLLPLLRYNRKDLGSYTGVDLAPQNVKFLTQRVTDGKPIPGDYYPFPVTYLEANAACMSEKLLPKKFDFIIYTSSIEHMQKETGQASLHECRKLITADGHLVITCPNTPEDHSGYDTQYAAHVYEWKRSELIAGLQEAGFTILSEWGLLIDRKTLEAQAERKGFLPILRQIENFIPSDWLLPVMAPLFPREAKEIGFLAKPL